MAICIPRRLSYYELLSGGHTGWVFKLNEQVALKYSARPNDEKFQNEIAFFDLIESFQPCPHIIQSFLRVPVGNFLSFMSGGNLEQRLYSRQIRSGNGELIGITGTEPHFLVERWMVELCTAASWLEKLGYVHGDIRPPNLLLDNQEHLKLADFDRVARIGTPANASRPQWARILGPEGGNEEGTFGKYGARTEQFAIGSILYCLTRGYEPFEMDRFDDDADVHDRMRRMEFPHLSDNRFDLVINKCWNDRYFYIKDLLGEVSLLMLSDEGAQTHELTFHNCSNIKAECQRLVNDGLLDLE